MAIGLVVVAGVSCGDKESPTNYTAGIMEGRGWVADGEVAGSPCSG